MGTNRLAAELFIYSAGLFPLLPNASLTVRSGLLTVYETHFVPLGPRLHPGLNGFLSGVLPGLEEGSEHELNPVADPQAGGRNHNGGSVRQDLAVEEVLDAARQGSWHQREVALRQLNAVLTGQEQRRALG